MHKLYSFYVREYAWFNMSLCGRVDRSVMPQREDVSMGMLAAIKNTIRSPENSDDVLLDMCRYGQPKLSMMDSGWHCWIKMHVASQGATFEIKSEFGHQSPRAAADECYTRIVATIKQIGA